MGANKSEAAAKIRKFAKRLYRWRYYLSDPESFEASIADFGLSLSEIWPKEEVTAMYRMAAMAAKFPEYADISFRVFKGGESKSDGV